MIHKSSDLKRVVNETVQNRLKLLSLDSFDGLSRLPSHKSEECVFQEKKFTLSVWHDVLSSGEHRIVVQAYTPGILSIGSMEADGFAINNQNEKRALTLEEWAPFS
jgi:hypothetical protein